MSISSPPAPGQGRLRCESRLTPAHAAEARDEQGDVAARVADARVVGARIAVVAVRGRGAAAGDRRRLAEPGLRLARVGRADLAVVAVDVEPRHALAELAALGPVAQVLVGARGPVGERETRDALSGGRVAARRLAAR